MWALAFLVSFSIQLAASEDDQTVGVKFLNQYGYLSMTRSGNHDVGTAVRRFQKFYGLPVSGEIDQATIGLMKKPRCGGRDPSGESRDRRYVPTGTKWSKTHLTYYVQPGYDLPAEQQRDIFGQAFQYWADVSDLSFSEVNSAYEADIKISFGTYTHGGTPAEGTCGIPFEGPGQVIAHAYFPTDGRAHFDEDETFTHGTSQGINLLWTATHEFGHSLGLDHTNVQGAIMYPYFTGYVPNMSLHSDDIAGIQSLYGNGGGGGGGGGTTAPTVPTVPGGCIDNNAFCQMFKQQGFCQSLPDMMKTWCAKTCFNCNV